MIPALQIKRPSGRFIFVHGRLQPFRPFIAFPLHVLPYHYNVMSLLCIFTAFRGSIPQACYFSLQSLIAVSRPVKEPLCWLSENLPLRACERIFHILLARTDRQFRGQKK